MTTRKMQIRVYESQVDDSGKMRWFADAGYPSGVNDQWIIFAELACGEPSRARAIEELGLLLWRRSKACNDAMAEWYRLVYKEDPWREWKALGRKLLRAFRRKVKE